MISFKAKIERFASQGEKTGWTYIRIPSAVARKIKKDQKTSFRVREKLKSWKSMPLPCCLWAMVILLLH